MKIMITGINGSIGSVVADLMSKDHEVYGIDVIKSDRPNTKYIDLADSVDDVSKTFEGMDVVLHLAADPRHDPWIGWKELMRPNMIATANVYSAAHKTGVRRFIFGGSMRVVAGYESEEPYASIINGNYEGIDKNKVSLIKGLGQDTKPNNEYAASKIFGESLGRYFSEFEKMEVLCVRIGSLKHGSDRPGHDPRSWVAFMSLRDVAGYFKACIEKKDVGYDILYAASDNDWKIYDTPYAYRYLNFQPLDNAENYRNK